MPGAVGPVRISGGSSVARATFSSAAVSMVGTFGSEEVVVVSAPCGVDSCAVVGGGTFSLAGGGGGTSATV